MSRGGWRQSQVVAVVIAAALGTPTTSWAGWYWIWPPPGGPAMYVNSDWTVVQPFENLAACEAVRGREYRKALEDARRVGANLDDSDNAPS
jgi:hypothetical protein